MDRPHLYALLVGIQDYLPPVQPLSGCVGDVQKVKEYLEQSEATHFVLRIKTLYNEEATKENVVRSFLDHLGQATERDHILFYFSGHGTQEYADTTYWSNEADGRLECLICYDSIQPGNSLHKLLADKELRWLLHKVTQHTEHGVVIFDCCNSGDNTRNDWFDDHLTDAKERRYFGKSERGAKQPFAKRALTDFIFWNEIAPHFAGGKSLEGYLPEGNYVQIGACKSNESAWESDGKGMFTHHLLEVLRRSQGAVTYFDLKSRVRHYIAHQFDQTPQIYTPGDQQYLFRGFLGKEATTKPLYGNVVFRAFKEGQGGEWIIDLGSLTGASARATTVTVEVEEKHYEMDVLAIHPDYASLDPTGSGTTLHPEQSYRGYFADFQSAPLGIHVINIDGDTEAETALRTATAKIKNLHYQGEVGADYAVLIKNGAYQIVLPGAENRQRPVVETVATVLRRNNEAQRSLAPVAASYIKHIAQWKYIRDLHHSSSVLFEKFPLEVALWELSDTDEYPLDVSNDRVELAYRKNRATEDPLLRYRNRPYLDLKLALTNTWAHTLHVGVLYLGMDFSSYPNIFKPAVISLEPGQSHTAMQHSLRSKVIPLAQEPYITDFQWAYERVYFKIFASTEKAALDEAMVRLELPKLPHPQLDFRKNDAKRGLVPEEDFMVADWTTRLIELTIQPYSSPQSFV